MTGEWLWEQDAHGRYTYSNASVTEILGFQPEEIIGKSYFEFFTKPEREKTIKSVYDTANKRDFVRLINHYRHKNGHEVVTESTGIPIFDERGLIVKWRGVDLDITAKQSAEVALQESEEKLRITFDNTPVGIATTDLDGRLVTTNPQFRKLFGYGSDDLIGVELWSLIDGEDAESLRRDWEMLVKGAPAKQEFERRFRHQDGKLLVLRIRAAVARDAEGRPLAIVSEFEDLTEHRRDLQEAVG
jgi:sigma-B regulation protein RsbU (phosphoserine phosphatase)